MSTLIGQEIGSSRAEQVLSFVGSARQSLETAVAELERALNVASYMGRNGELLRQLNIARTQIQGGDLWIGAALQQLPKSTEEV